ncbi:MAG: OmpH family outer membrane protein [Paludibacteraceae bacterium]|jgi:outer membrane protein|nr:OmpH family outer membrane protein [Paludibacteraceae bacterium]
MKKLLLFIAAAITLASCNQPATQNESATSESACCNTKIEDGCRLPIAVVNVDSLLNNYDLALEENERLMRKQEDITLDLNQRARSLENEMIDFQKKLENQAFLSRERAEAEQRRLMKKEQDLQLLGQEKQAELLQDNQQVGIRVQDSINSAIRTLNANGKYHLVITTSALNNNVLFVAPEYDITAEAIELLNERYNKEK